MTYFLIVNGIDPRTKTKKNHTALDILQSHRPAVSANKDNFVMKSFTLTEIILERAEKGKGLNGHAINEESIRQSNDVILNMPGLANALVMYDLEDELHDLYYLNRSIIDESDDNGWVSYYFISAKTH